MPLSDAEFNAILDGKPLAPPVAPLPPPPAEDAGKPGMLEAVERGVGRGAWMLPGLVGLTHARAQSLADALGSAVKGELPTDSLEHFKQAFMAKAGKTYQAQRDAETAAERAHPIATGLAVGAGATPSLALAGEVVPAANLGVSLAGRAASSALTAGGQGALVGLGVSNKETAGGRLADAGAGALTAAPLGALAPRAAPGAAAAAAAEPPPVRPTVQDRLRTFAGERNLKAAGGIQSDIVRARRQIGRERLTDLGSEMGEQKLVGPTTTPAKTYERAAALIDSAGNKMGEILRAADADAAEGSPTTPTAKELVGRATDEILLPLAKNPHQREAATRFRDLMQNYLDEYGDEPLSFSQMHDIRKNISSDLYGMRGTQDPFATAYKGALHDFRGLVSDEINGGLESAGLDSSSWKAANRAYEVASRAQEFADKGMDRNHGNNLVSPMEALAGMSALAGGSAAGHTGIGLTGLGATLATALARRHGSGTLGWLAGGAADALERAPRLDPSFATLRSALLRDGSTSGGIGASARLMPDAMLRLGGEMTATGSPTPATDRSQPTPPGATGAPQGATPQPRGDRSSPRPDGSTSRDDSTTPHPDAAGFHGPVSIGALAEHAPQLQAAGASGGKEAMAAAHYELAQQGERYRHLMRAIGSRKEP